MATTDAITSDDDFGPPPLDYLYSRQIRPRRDGPYATFVRDMNQPTSAAERLRQAAGKGELGVVGDLLHAGVPMEPDKDGRHPLHYASLNGQLNTLRMLLDASAEVDIRDNLGYTALHKAAAQGHVDIIQLLVTNGADPNRQDTLHGNSPLHEAAWHGYSSSVDALCRSRAYVNILNKSNFTSLHLAAQNGHNQSARVLLYAGCDPNAKNNYGDTSLHTAARYGHAGVTRILVSAKSHINEVNKNLDTALHIAAALKRRKIAKLLIDAGADTTLRNMQSETPVDVAKRKCHAEILNILVGKREDGNTLQKMQPFDPMPDGPPAGPPHLAYAYSDRRPYPSFPQTEQFPPREQEVRLPPQGQSCESGSAPEDDKKKTKKKSFFSLFRKKKVKEPQVSTDKGHKSSTNQNIDPKAKPSAATNGSKGVEHVPGLLSHYHPYNGTQYYRDLAGNVKESAYPWYYTRPTHPHERPYLPEPYYQRNMGPIGYAPVAQTCTCLQRQQLLENAQWNHVPVALGPCIDHGYAEYHGPIRQQVPQQPQQPAHVQRPQAAAAPTGGPGPVSLGATLFPDTAPPGRMVRTRSDESLNMSEHKQRTQEERLRQLAMREMQGVRLVGSPVRGRKDVGQQGDWNKAPRVPVDVAQRTRRVSHTEIQAKMEHIAREYGRPSPDGQTDGPVDSGPVENRLQEPSKRPGPPVKASMAPMPSGDRGRPIPQPLSTWHVRFRPPPQPIERTNREAGNRMGTDV